jgi:hypothetical protein
LSTLTHRVSETLGNRLAAYFAPRCIFRRRNQEGGEAVRNAERFRIQCDLFSIRMSQNRI